MPQTRKTKRRNEGLERVPEEPQQGVQNGTKKKRKGKGHNQIIFVKEAVQDIEDVPVTEIHLDELPEAPSEEPAVEEPAVMEVDEVEVDEEVPRKRDAKGYMPDDTETWINPIKIEDLDLHVSHLDDELNPEQIELARYQEALEATAETYIDSDREEEESSGEKEPQGPEEGLKEQTPPQTYKRKRWINKGPTIHNIDDAPADWNEHEPDIHPLDYVRLIERCRERIQDNILPSLFEAKIKNYEELKQIQDEARADHAAKYPGLDVATVTRLEDLMEMRKILEREGNDRFDQMINIKALISAYKSGSLKWYGKGFVTYWSEGIQRSQPRGFKLEEFACLRQHFPSKSFWVEGMNGPGSQHCGMATHSYVDVPWNPPSYNNYIRISVKLPQGWNYTRLTFMQDTGATFMTLYETDLYYLQELDSAVIRGAGIPIPMIGCHGYTTLLTVGGRVTVPLTLMKVALHHEPSAEQMTSWDTIQVAVMRGSRQLLPGTVNAPRMDGVWPRWKLFRGSSPIPIDMNATFLTEFRAPLIRAMGITGSRVSHARTPIGPLGPPIVAALGGPATRLPGPGLNQPLGVAPPAQHARAAWTGPTPIPPPGVIPAVGQVIAPPAGKMMIPGGAYVPFEPPLAAVAFAATGFCSFWDP